MRFARAAIAAIAAFVGCANGDGGALEEVREARSAIQGGQEAPAPVGVAALLRCAGPCKDVDAGASVQGICSASILTPKLLLTARHCVAQAIEDQPSVACSLARFTGSDRPETMAVATAPKAPFTRLLTVARVHVPRSDAYCGADIALVELSEPASGAGVLTPRLDRQPERREMVTAIGYGSDRSGVGTGTRRSRAGLSVLCVGAACTELGRDRGPAVAGGEFFSEGAGCGGDSGGPAVGKGGVLGVLSRASGDCTQAAYERVDVHADWLREVVRSRSILLGDAVPAWATLPLVDDAGATVPGSGRAPPFPFGLPEARPTPTGDYGPAGGCALAAGTRLGGWPATGGIAATAMALLLARVRRARTVSRRLPKRLDSV